MPRTRLLLPLCAAWFVAILLAFHFGPGEFLPGQLAALVRDLTLLSLIGMAALGLGSLIMKPLAAVGRCHGERFFFEIGAGLGGLALAVFFISAAGMLYRPVVIGLLAICLAALILRARAGGVGDATARTWWTRSEILLLTVISLVGAATLLCSLAPPEFYDSLIYHLAVPDQYIRHHGMTAIPGNYYAHYPANMGMLYAIGLLLSGGGLAQSIHWLCFAVASGALFSMAFRHVDRVTGLLASLFFTLTPGVMLASTWAIADLGVTMFGVLCFAAVLNHRQGGDRRWLATAGLFAGLALGAKYTAAITVCLPVAAVVMTGSPHGAATVGVRRRFLNVGLLAGIALLVMSPWLARNAVYTGNPVAPYFRSGDAAREAVHPDLGAELARRLPEEPGPAALAAHYLGAPWQVTMTRMGAAGYLGPVFLMLVPFLFFMRGLPRVVRPVALMVAVGFAGWALTTQVTRYLFPILPLIALLAALAARRLPKILTIPSLTWALGYNLLLFFFLAGTIGSFRVVTGVESVEAFLARRVSYHPAMMWLSASTPPSARILFVGEGRGFYCPRAYAASTPFDAPLLDAYAARAGNDRALLAILREEGFTHLLVSGPELARTRNLTAGQVMGRFFPSGGPRLVFESNDVRIYELTVE